jgi:hypothetical protein
MLPTIQIPSFFKLSSTWGMFVSLATGKCSRAPIADFAAAEVRPTE